MQPPGFGGAQPLSYTQHTTSQHTRAPRADPYLKGRPTTPTWVDKALDAASLAPITVTAQQQCETTDCNERVTNTAFLTAGEQELQARVDVDTPCECTTNINPVNVQNAALGTAEVPFTWWVCARRPHTWRALLQRVALTSPRMPLFGWRAMRHPAPALHAQ